MMVQAFCGNICGQHPGTCDNIVLFCLLLKFDEIYLIVIKAGSYATKNKLNRTV